MTDLQKAARAQEDVKEIDQRIKSAEDMRDFAIKHRDEVGKTTWSKIIRELKRERHNIHESVKYIELTTFIKVVKGYVTKEQYAEIWDRVRYILENPETTRQQNLN